jgi:hypothetical protein
LAGFVFFEHFQQFAAKFDLVRFRVRSPGHHGRPNKFVQFVGCPARHPIVLKGPDKVIDIRTIDRRQINRR